MGEEQKQVAAQPIQPEAVTEQKPDENRRELLKKVGKFAAYTPPALVGLYDMKAISLNPSGQR